jgi:hypothetical protein
MLAFSLACCERKDDLGASYGGGQDPVSKFLIQNINNILLDFLLKCTRIYKLIILYLGWRLATSN